MRIATIFLILLGMAFGLLGLRSSNAAASRQWRHQEADVAFVTRVHKEGFQTSEFERFAYSVHERQKDAVLDPWVLQTCHRISLALVFVAAGFIWFKWPRR